MRSRIWFKKCFSCVFCKNNPRLEGYFFEKMILEKVRRSSYYVSYMIHHAVTVDLLTEKLFFLNFFWWENFWLDYLSSSLKSSFYLISIFKTRYFCKNVVKISFLLQKLQFFDKKSQFFIIYPLKMSKYLLLWYFSL